VSEDMERDMDISSQKSGETSLKGRRMLNVGVVSLFGNKWNSKAFMEVLAEN